MLEVKAEVKLRTALSGIDLPDWVGIDTIIPENRIVVGDTVVADNWVGQVEEVSEAVPLRARNKKLMDPSCDADRSFKKRSSRMSTDESRSEYATLTPAC